MSRPTLVVDASVAVKWVLPEEDTPRALRIQERYQDEELDLIAPYLVVCEVANVLWRRERRGDLNATTAARCFEQFLRDSPILLDSAAVNYTALALAFAHGRPMYDCLYLAWALERRCDMVTADERFFNAIRPAFPCVQLLRSLEV
jgi:predicted nucleic acid-binding protein